MGSLSTPLDRDRTEGFYVSRVVYGIPPFDPFPFPRRRVIVAEALQRLCHVRAYFEGLHSRRCLSKVASPNRIGKPANRRSATLRYSRTFFFTPAPKQSLRCSISCERISRKPS